MAKDGLDAVALELHAMLSAKGMACYYDDSGSIGRRYARMDEIGTPCCVTVDYDTKSDGTVTIRERDSAEQVRIPKDLVPGAVESLMKGVPLNKLPGTK
jgi:glycyl-tRNA synthetase